MKFVTPMLAASILLTACQTPRGASSSAINESAEIERDAICEAFRPEPVPEADALASPLSIQLLLRNLADTYTEFCM